MADEVKGSRAYHEAPLETPTPTPTPTGQGNRGAGGRPEADDDRHVQLAHAYLHLALYYLALTDSGSAKQTFKVLIRLYRDRRLNPDVYPPRVIELFEEARAELAREDRGPQKPPPSV